MNDRTRLGMALVAVGFVGAWFGVWPAVMTVGVILAWPMKELA